MSRLPPPLDPSFDHAVRASDLAAKRFGRVSRFVRFPDPEPRWQRPMAIATGLVVGGLVGLTHPLIAGAFAGVATTLLVVSLRRSAARRRRAWARWAASFEEDLPYLLDELGSLPTTNRLFLAGVALGHRLRVERIPEVPASVVRGVRDPAERLLRWVSDALEEIGEPFHRGLEKAWQEEPVNRRRG